MLKLTAIVPFGLRIWKPALSLPVRLPNVCPFPPADGVDAVAVVVGRRELVVCDRDVARSASAIAYPLGSSRPGTASLVVLVGVGVGVGVHLLA